MVAPRATYRLQLEPDFGFDSVAELAPYLHDLGVSHAYLSPCFEAAPGSRHGYDVVDFTRPSEQLGGQSGQRRMNAALSKAQLGQVVDLVPNHMSTREENRWWQEVLRDGERSTFARYFDIDWPVAFGRVVLPLLGPRPARGPARPRLRLLREGAQLSFVLDGGPRLPLATQSWAGLLRRASRRAASESGLAVAAELAGLESDPSPPAWRRRHAEALVRLQRALTEAGLTRSLDTEIEQANGSPRQLARILGRQHYRLVSWDSPAPTLNYRRFADITGLAALRTEDQQVFAAIHGLVSEWAESGQAQGLRVDHPDGLTDPAGYLRRLNAMAPGSWIVVEKILQPGEMLPPAWPVAGSTGYDFAALALGLLVDGSGRAGLKSARRRLTGSRSDFARVAHNSKLWVMRHNLASEVNRLTVLLEASSAQVGAPPISRRELADGLREVLAALDVYRTYASATKMRAADRATLERALGTAARARPDLDPEPLGTIRRVLLEGGSVPPRPEFLARFQQTSPAVMAKGVEDTAFYRHVELLCLNEVGSDPDRYGTSIAEFDRACRRRARSSPAAMLATSTHDTKRSEDVRARLALISEMPAEWERTCREWMLIAARYAAPSAPSRRDVYLLLQTLFGAWPLDAGRALAYIEKATREAGLRTSWRKVDLAYEQSLREVVLGLLGDDDFLSSMTAFVRRHQDATWVNCLSYKLLCLTAPGVPDIYRGTELWDFSLVDPDNRRPVDFDLRHRLLLRCRALDGATAWEERESGLPKLLLVARALAVRRDLPTAFAPGSSYAPLKVLGLRAQHLVAYARGGRVVTLCPRLVLGLERGWADTRVRLPAGHWQDVFSGTTVAGGEQPARELLERFPVGLLVSADA
ncbi:MAG TPA: malto-oligosyltrehalose synthase [Candidatus Nitrosotalea sp.]|nr:malto-oligosyltrehalose synthase [Candidatus Nitrosotalea sp.]